MHYVKPKNGIKKRILRYLLMGILKFTQKISVLISTKRAIF